MLSVPSVRLKEGEWFLSSYYFPKCGKKREIVEISKGKANCEDQGKEEVRWKMLG